MITFIEQGNRIATENFEIGEIYTITFTNGNYKTMCCIGLGSDFVMFQDKLPNALFCLTLGTAETVSTIEIGGGGSGTMNYNELENKPQINGIVLIGNKTAADLNLASTSDLASKQDSLTETQLTAVNSGITSSLVTQIGTNTMAISGKQDTLSASQLTAVNSGITSPLVTQIGTNQNNISITDITSTFTAGVNITIDNRSKVYIQNKRVFGQLILQSTTAFSSTAQTVISAMAYPPATATICGGFLSDTGWSVKGVAYVYTSSAWSVRVDTGVTGCGYVIIPIDYMTT